MEKTQNKVLRNYEKLPIGLAPCGIKTVAANVEIPWNIITCAEDMTIYFADDEETTWTVDAGTKLGVHPNLRLVSAAICLVF